MSLGQVGMYKDLREFIGLVDKLQALRRVAGADPLFEIGGITEVAAGLPDGPAVLFDDIKGFPRGFRIFTNATTNPQRAALALGLDPALRAPTLHRHDGGPFIGSGSIVIMRDPDTRNPDGGWINASIYRVQVHGKN